MTERANKVALINMPFSSASRPALGISLLQAGLRRAGIECDLHYLNLNFAARIGVDDYNHVAYGLIEEALAGEWVFRDELFGPASGESANYLKDILLEKFPKHFPFSVVLGLLKMREAAAGYLEECLEAQDWSQYGIVGFTTTFQQNLASLALAKKSKRAIRRF